MPILKMSKQQERLDWLLRHQPNNIVAINALRSTMDRKKPVVLPDPEKVPESLKPFVDRYAEAWGRLKPASLHSLYAIGSSLEEFRGFCHFLRLHSAHQ